MNNKNPQANLAAELLSVYTLLEAGAVIFKSNW